MNAVRGSMHGSRSNSANNNPDNVGGAYTDNYGDYRYRDRYGEYGRYGTYGFYPPEMIFEYNCGNNVDISNLNVGDSVTVALLLIIIGPGAAYEDTNDRRFSRVQLKIGFSCNLNYSITLDEEMNLLFKLYRQDRYGRRIQLTSIPYNVSLYGTQENETEFLTTELKKNETFYTEYFDELKDDGTYTYVMEVSLVYSSIDSASIQSGYISACGQAFYGCYR